MKSNFTLLLLFFASLGFSQSLNPYTVNVQLQEAIDTHPNDWHEVLIFFADHVDTPIMDENFRARNLTMSQRTHELLSALQTKATTVQAPYLHEFQNSDQIRNVQSFWITNFIYAEVKADYLAILSHDPAFSSIEPNSDLESSKYTVTNAAAPPPTPNNSEPGLRAIMADTLWEMGYTGYGTIAFCVDTGTDVYHPALTDNFHGNNVPINQAWFGSNFSDVPEDCDGHGTHVTGTMVGLDRSTNDTIGVAFNAEWTASPPIVCANGIVSAIASFQWALNPDNNSMTIDDMPDVINNSWGIPDFTNCGGNLASVMNTMEASKIAVVFAAGNEGPNAGTVFNPSNINTGLVNTFTVAAVQHSTGYNIADFSSRGPSNCPGEGSLAIKPEVSAPGVNVRSSFLDGEYESISGTSMASPHVSGAILLLREAFPETTGADLKMALYMSAIDLGNEGEDNTYGMGMINVPAAFDYLIEQGFTPVPPTAKEHDIIALDLNVSPIVCPEIFAFNISFENAGTVPLTDLLIAYNIGSFSGSYQWSGNLLPDEIASVYIEETDLSAGDYELQIVLSAPNGLVDDRPLNNKIVRQVKINNDTPLSAYTEGNLNTYCMESEVALRVDYQGIGSITTRWYEELTGGNSIGVGNVFTVANLTETQTFYAESKYLWPAGKPELSSQIGFAGVTNPGIQFDAFQDFRLKSVVIYFEEPGARLFNLEDVGGEVIDSKIVNATGAGQNRVTLNFDVPQGNNYKLKFIQGLPLLSNIEGAQFPYILDNVVRLDKSLAGNPQQSLSKYHCFYDWEIEFPTSCGRLPVTVNVVPGDNVPMAAFTSSQTELSLINGEATIEFTNTSEAATSFIWNFADGATDNTNQSPTHTFTEEGIYIVSLTVFNADGCSDTETTEIIVTQELVNNIDDISTPMWDIALFPNPTQDKLMINFALEETQNLSYRVVDIYGRSIITSAAQNYRTAQVSLDMADVSAGVYYVIFENKGQRMVRKVVKI